MTLDSPLLVLGTHNQKKLAELVLLLNPFGFKMRSLAQIAGAIEVEESGSTFAENARLKACEQAKHLREWVVAEDSGISVDALNGQPGVYSARFSGSHATDESNNRLLLERLAEIPRSKRTAYYTCHVTLADPNGNARIDYEEYCHGRIGFEPKGSNGFGYDPLFEIIEYGLTFGQLGDSVKSILSHRAKAIRRFVVELQRFSFSSLD